MTLLLFSDNLYKALQLLISLGAFVAIVWLFLKYCSSRRTINNQDRDSDEKDSNQFRWIHTLYIGGIATFIILEFIVYVVLNNEEKDNIIDTISFGATLASLILSIVAIIFTIVQGRNGETQLGQITQATEELKTTASTLGGFKDVADDIDNKIEIINQTINEKISQINDVLKEVRDKTTEVREHQKLVQNQTAESPTAKINSRFSIENYLNGGSYTGALAILACCYASQKHKNIDFNDIYDAFVTPSIDYIFGYLISSYATGIIAFDGTFPQISNVAVAEDVEKACLNKIKAFIQTVPPESQNDFFNRLDVLTSYFEVPPINKDDLLRRSSQ